MQPNDLSRPRVARHSLGLLIRGAIAGGLLYGLLAGIEAESSWWLLLSVAALFGLFAAGTARSIHSLFFGPRLVLDTDGIHLRYWKVTQSLMELLIPWRRAVELTLPWSLCTGLRTNEVYCGGVTSAVLNVETPNGILVIGGDVFALSVDDLMSAIAGHLEVQRQLPLRVLSQFEEFQKARFVEPVRMVAGFDDADPVLVGCLSTFMIALALYFIVGAYHKGYTTLATSAGVGLLLLIAAVIFYLRSLDTVYSKIIECRSEGLALGRVDRKLLLTPWSDVLSSRLIESTIQVENRTPSSSIRLELNLKGRGPVRINPVHDRTPSEIQELVMPPLEKVFAVRQLMSEKGVDMPAAAAAVGLSFATAAVPARPAEIPHDR
jgi:hypothetical protein